MIIDEKTIVVAHEAVGEGYMRMKVRAPKLSAELQPGQFVHLKIPALEASALRRPISVFNADAATGEVELLYKQVGRGTTALAQLKVGEELSVLGPLGFGFPVECAGVPLLVGGGFGVAPLYFLARRQVASGRKPILFVGGRTAKDLLAVDDFKALGVEVRMTTNDGSAGVKGFAVVPLDEEIARLNAVGEKFALYTCGPDGLLKAVSDRAVANKMPGYISMDRHMVCGVGACFACIQKVWRGGQEFNARCCVNGPVFKAEELVW